MVALLEGRRPEESVLFAEEEDADIFWVHQHDGITGFAGRCREHGSSWEKQVYFFVHFQKYDGAELAAVCARSKLSLSQGQSLFVSNWSRNP